MVPLISELPFIISVSYITDMSMVDLPHPTVPMMVRKSPRFMSKLISEIIG